MGKGRNYKSVSSNGTAIIISYLLLYKSSSLYALLLLFFIIPEYIQGNLIC